MIVTVQIAVKGLSLKQVRALEGIRNGAETRNGKYGKIKNADYAALLHRFYSSSAAVCVFSPRRRIVLGDIP